MFCPVPSKYYMKWQFNLSFFSIFRRRKSFHQFGSDCSTARHINNDLSSLPHRSQPQQKHYMVGQVNPAVDCSTPTHVSHTLGPSGLKNGFRNPTNQNQLIVHEGHAVTSLVNVNGRAGQHQTITTRLGNHYIPDVHNSQPGKMMTLDNPNVVSLRHQLFQVN